jgi:2',3'-cyclic-nucleotide 2'-phosphodiesterase (5'-nucleotidase family)
VARRATRLKFERQQAAHVLVVDAGDSLMGDSDPALKTLGATSVEALNRLGYDAIALGPLDLILGAERLRARIQEAKFAVVAANVRLADGGDYLAQPYIIRAIDGHRIAIIGLAPQAEGKGLVISDPLTTLREIMAEITPQADIILVLSHAGAEVDRAIAAQVPDVDVVVTGEASPPLDLWRKEDGGVPILHADVALPGHAGRNLGRAVLQFDAEGRLTDIQWSRTTLGPQIPSDPAMLEWIRSLAQE